MCFYPINSSLAVLKYQSLIRFTIFVLLSAVTQTGLAEVDIVYDKEKFLDTLQSMPYAEEGTKGPILYIFGYSECPYCQALEKDWKGKLGDIRIRRFFYAVSQRSADETAALALSRSTKDYYAFMQRRKTAPNVRQSNKNINALNSVIGPINKVIDPILLKNKWPARGIISPTYIWEADGHLWAAGGYRKDYFQSVITSLRNQEIPVYTKDKIISVNPEGLKKKKVGTKKAAKTNSKKSKPSAAGDIFSIQGITTGMTKKDIEDHLQSTGWKRISAAHLGSWAKTSETKRKQLSFKYYGSKVLAGEIKYTLSITTPNYNYDHKAMLQQLRNRYGKPHFEQFANLRYWEQPNAPTQKEMVQACKAEMVRKGMPASQALGKAQGAGSVTAWARLGDSVVRKNCPGVLSKWQKFRDRQLGKYLDITANPRSPTVVITLWERMIEQLATRELLMKKERARKAAPKGKLDASDF